MNTTLRKRRRMAFTPLSAGTDTECFLCRIRPSSVFPKSALVLPDAVKITCDSCLRQVPQSVMNVAEPEAKLFCPVCNVETTVVGTDAVVHLPASKSKYTDYVIGPYSAVCSRCITFLRTIHPSPRAALDYWRDYPEQIPRPT